jgi:hypothetical protein
MKHLMILFASSMLFACGSGDSTASTDSSEGRAANPIDEKADALHDALDAAHEVEAILEDQKKAIDDALEEAEGSPD